MTDYLYKLIKKRTQMNLFDQDMNITIILLLFIMVIPSLIFLWFIRKKLKLQ